MPPAGSVRARPAMRWLRANLFNSVFNGALTLALAALASWALVAVLRWGVVDAVWRAPDGHACRRVGDGACWAFIGVWHRFILFGRYPYAEQWRPALVVVILTALLFASCRRAWWRRALAGAWLLGFAASFVLMRGGVLGLSRVDTNLWNGLPLTLILAILGLGAAFPAAIGLALARRSTLPAVRALAIGYIELIRGVPLITVLFMATVMFPLFLPQGVTVNKLAAAQIGLILFYAAYLAEVVRGGLQAVPKGQDEAAAALGLGGWQRLRLVILPQALRIALPALVNTFIAAFKDTTLVTVVGLFDLITTAGNAITDPQWRGFFLEAYVFIGAIYFAVCALLSHSSARLEREVR